MRSPGEVFCPLRLQWEVWTDWRFDSAANYRACLDIICIQDVEHRLIFSCEVAKLKIFQVCKIPEGAGFDEVAVQRIALEILASYRACNDCVDLLFSVIWARRLTELGSYVCKLAHRALCTLLAALRVSSTVGGEKTFIGSGRKACEAGLASCR